MKATWRKSGDGVVAVLIFVAAAAGSGCFLIHDHIKVRQDAEAEDGSFLPAMLWATGHGLSCTLDPLPKCAAFLAQDQERLEPGSVPDHVRCLSSQSKFDQDRQNLLYCIGFFWWLFGVSWTSAKIFMALVYATVAVLTYALFRLGMNRGLSLAGAAIAMTTPIMLDQASWPRSLCKAPFILAGILIIALLLTRKLRPRGLLALAVLMGIVIGIGFGFRQDPVICLPPAAAAILLGARLEAARGAAWRVLACGLMLAAFAACGWPSLRMTRDTGGNNAFYLLQGCAAKSFEDAGLRSSYYAPVLSNRDQFVHGLLSDYAKKTGAVPIDDYGSVRLMGLAHFAAMLQCAPARVIPNLAAMKQIGDCDNLPFWTHKAELVTRQLVRNVYQTFPADMIARWYGCALRMLRDLQNGDMSISPSTTRAAAAACHRPLALHLDRYGHWYAAAALILIASRNAWLAACAFCMVLYFSGYTSLNFQVRHAFHMNFLAFWPALFILGAAGRTAAGLYAAGLRGGIRRALQFRAWLPRVAVMAGFCLGAIVLLAVPLFGARLYQDVRVKRICEQYRRADLEKIPFRVEQRDGNSVWMVDAFPAFRQLPIEKASDYLAGLGIPAPAAPIVRAEYVALDIETVGNYVNLQYMENAGASGHYFPGAPNKASMRVFIPVFKYADSYIARDSSGASANFTGFMPNPGVTIKNIYRVRNADAFPMLMTVWLPDDPARIRWHQEVPLWISGAGT